MPLINDPAIILPDAVTRTKIAPGAVGEDEVDNSRKKGVANGIPSLNSSVQLAEPHINTDVLYDSIHPFRRIFSKTDPVTTADMYEYVGGDAAQAVIGDHRHVDGGVGNDSRLSWRTYRKIHIGDIASIINIYLDNIIYGSSPIEYSPPKIEVGMFSNNISSSLDTIKWISLQSTNGMWVGKLGNPIGGSTVGSLYKANASLFTVVVSLTKVSFFVDGELVGSTTSGIPTDDMFVGVTVRNGAVVDTAVSLDILEISYTNYIDAV
jgi:hypothetical protein